MCPLEATWSERMFGVSDVGAFLFRDDSSLVSSHKWDRGGVGTGRRGPRGDGRRAFRERHDARRSRAASGSSRRRALHPARSFRGRRARRAGHARGQFGRRRRDGRWVVSPGRGARVVRARSRAGGGAGAAAVDADAPRSDVAAATAWMLARLDEAAAEARRARRDETRRAETKLTNVRASHETRLRALDARHRAALDAWKRDELTRARNAARKLVRDTEARAEGVVREARASQEAAEARARARASRAEAAEEEEARATRARLDACLHRHSRVAAMRDASASRARSRLMRRRAFEAWRFFFATTASARARGDAESAGDALASARRGLARAERRVRAALAFAGVRARLSLLSSTGAFAFGAWRRANRASKRAAAIADARAGGGFARARTNRRGVPRRAGGRGAFGGVSGVAPGLGGGCREARGARARAVGAEASRGARRVQGARESHRLVREKAVPIRDASLATPPRARRGGGWRTRRGGPEARTGAHDTARDGVVACVRGVHAQTTRTSGARLLGGVEKTPRVRRVARARGARRPARARDAARATAAVARTCMARLADSEALAATRPLLFLERAFGARYAGSRNRRARDMWSRVLEGRRDTRRDAKTASSVGQKSNKMRGLRMTDPNSNRVDALLDARDDVGVARRRARLFAARVAHAFVAWSDLSRNESFRRSIAIEKHRVRRPLRPRFSVVARSRRVGKGSNRRRRGGGARSRRVALAAWWLLAAETAEAGASAGDCSPPETPRRDPARGPGDPAAAPRGGARSRLCGGRPRAGRPPRTGSAPR